MSHINLLKKIALILLKLNIAAFAFYLVFLKLDIEKFLNYVRNANIFLLIAALLFSNISLILSGLRGRFYLEQYGLKLKRKFCIILYYIGTLFNIILPGGVGGDGYKVYLLWKLENFSKIKALRVALYERTNGFYALILLGFVFILISDFVSKFSYLSTLTWILLILVTPVYLIGVKYILRDQVNIAIKASYYSIFVQILQILMVACIVYSLKQTLDFQNLINFIVMFIIASIVAIIPISIGGAGLRELTFLYLAGLLNPNLQELGVAIGLMSFFIYVLTSIPGLFFIFNIRNIKRKKVV